MKWQRVALVAVVVAATAFTRDATAWKTLNKSPFSCQRSTGAGTGILAYKGLSGGAGVGPEGVYNSSTTQTLWLYCPIEWQATNSIMSVSNVLVRFRDYTTTESIVCLIGAYDANLSAYYGNAKYSCPNWTNGGCDADISPSGTSSTGVDTYLNITSTPTSGTYYNYFLWCGVPKTGTNNSGIWAYQVNYDETQ